MKVHGEAASRALASSDSLVRHAEAAAGREVLAGGSRPVMASR